VKACFDKGYVRNLEIDYVDAKGNITPIEINATCIDIDGKTHTITICRDITERKRAEEDLKENERRYRLLTEKMSDIVWIADLNLRTNYISPSIKNVLGFSQEERLRQKLDEQLTPHSLSLVLEVLSRELALEEQGNADPNRTLKMELEYYHKDGSTRWMELVISGIRNDQDVLTGIHGVSRDISERKKAEEEISKLAAVVQFSSELVNLATLDGKMIFLNESGSKMLGIDPDNVGDYSIMDVIPKPFEPTVRQEILPVLLAGNNWEGELQYRNIRTGVLTDVHAMTFTIKDAATGTPLHLANVSRDITERKHTEEKLRKEEQRFRVLAEQSSDIILLINREKTIIYENPAVERILGMKREDRIGKNVLENLHPDDFPIVLNTFDALIGGKNASSQHDEIRIRHADGSWHTFEAVASNLTNENIVEAMIINLRDISERKQAEEKLQQTLKSLRRAVGATIQVLVSAVESRDSYTAGHQSRSANLACAIATEMGLAQEKIEGIRMAGIIHDIGKLSIPAEILSKPTKLTDIEFALIKEHSRSGYEMLKDVDSPWPLAEIVYQHHERINGSGYPRNLKGNEILIESRILAVADVVEAMASHRPYRAALGIEAALEEIEKNKGILYATVTADACLKLFREKGYQLK
jgi:PAS domain S-box-containing protein/putative nucleotidyltransferase with HDIG domain